MARNYVTSLLAVAMLLCTLSAVGAQQAAQPAQQPQAKPAAKPHRAKPAQSQAATEPAQPAAPIQQPRPNFGDDVPHSWGGLPEGAPARQKIIAPTPAVHDMPPPRATKPLSDPQQLTMEKELDATRTRTKKLEDPNIEKRAKASTAANAAALEGARKQAGNPKPKEPKDLKPPKEPKPTPQ